MIEKKDVLNLQSIENADITPSSVFQPVYYLPSINKFLSYINGSYTIDGEEIELDLPFEINTLAVKGNKVYFYNSELIGNTTLVFRCALYEITNSYPYLNKVKIFEDVSVATTNVGSFNQTYIVNDDDIDVLGSCSSKSSITVFYVENQELKTFNFTSSYFRNIAFAQVLYINKDYILGSGNPKCVVQDSTTADKRVLYHISGAADDFTEDDTLAEFMYNKTQVVLFYKYNNKLYIIQVIKNPFFIGYIADLDTWDTTYLAFCGIDEKNLISEEISSLRAPQYISGDLSDGNSLKLFIAAFNRSDSSYKSKCMFLTFGNGNTIENKITISKDDLWGCYDSVFSINQDYSNQYTVFQKFDKASFTYSDNSNTYYINLHNANNNMLYFANLTTSFDGNGISIPYITINGTQVNLGEQKKSFTYQDDITIDYEYAYNFSISLTDKLGHSFQDITSDYGYNKPSPSSRPIVSFSANITTSSPDGSQILTVIFKDDKNNSYGYVYKYSSGFSISKLSLEGETDYNFVNNSIPETKFSPSILSDTNFIITSGLAPFPITLVDKNNLPFSIYEMNMDDGSLGEINNDLFKNITQEIVVVGAINGSNAGLPGIVLQIADASFTYIIVGCLIYEKEVSLNSITINGQEYKVNEQNMAIATDLAINSPTEVIINTSISSSTTTYHIRFLNYDGSVLQEMDVEENETPSYTASTPQRTGYTFTGWTPALAPATQDQDYQATFSINTYLITFASEDGIPLETKEVEYGETPEYTGEEPTKEGYVFLGWTPTPYPANKNQTYTPRFRINSFTIRFLGENDEVLQEETLEYGATPIYKGATPTKEHYDFAGWTPEIYPVNRNQDYKVKFTEHYYTITLLNEDGSLFMTVKTLFGDPLDSLPTPEPEQEGYVFDKWLPDIQAVSGDATYTASFRIKTFTIRFLNYDGSVLQSEVLEYGATPVYKEDTPIKVGSTFLGWKPDIYSVNKDQDYTAQFSVATHNLVFKANGETLWQKTYQGELTKIEVNTLVNLTLSFTDNKGKSSKQILDFENTTNISGFTINGQNYSVNEAHNVSYDSDIEANLTFYSTQHYRIRWSVDGIIQTEYSQIVESGTIPTYDGPTPSKEGHTFLGWTPTPYPADKNQDYAAILRSDNAFTITVRDSENRELNQAPDNNHDFGSDLIISKLRFKQSRIIPYGQMISVFFNENETADLLVSYDPEYNVEVNSVVIGGTTHFITSDDDEMNLLTPLQSSFEMVFHTRATYHIRFLDEDGTLLYQTYVSLNETPRYVGELPSKDENYVFVGWTPALAPATQDQDYTAVYEWSGYKITSITNTLDIPITNELPLLIHNKEVGAAVNKVSVKSGIGDVEITFYFAKNYADGTQYSEKFTLTYDRNYLTQNNLNLPYTEEVVIDGNTIAADGEKHDIEFDAGASISIEIHNKKTYLTRFLNYDSAVLYSTLTVDGETPVYVGDTPTRENYIFIGWSPSPYPADKNQDYIARFKVAFEIMYKSANGTLKSYNAVRMVYKDGTSKTFTKARFDKKENN